jgi:glutathione S-transferase
VRLYTIPISHYCEKARWALDMTGFAYTEERHLQASHWRPVRRAGCSRTVPVLATGDRVLAESHDLLELAGDHVEPSLFPTDEAAVLEAEYDAIARTLPSWIRSELRQSARR